MAPGTGDIPPPPYKIVLLGDSSVGKTSLVHRFTTNSFDQHTSNTIGAAFITKEFTSPQHPEKKVKFEIWDTAGQERYRSLTPMYYRNAKVALICFDLSNPQETFERAKYWIDQLLMHRGTPGEDSIIIKLVGNKLDLSRVAGNAAEIEEYCQNNHITTYETSAKTGEGVEVIFEQIVNDLDQKFFDDYYEEAKKKDTQRDFLHTRIERTLSCC